MWRPKTLRVRFATWTALLFLLGLSVLGILVYVSMARGLTAAQDRALALVAAQVVAGLEFTDDRLVFPEDFASEPENVDFLERGFTVRVIPTNGGVVEFGALAPLLRTSENSLARLPPLVAGDRIFRDVINVPGQGGARAVVAPIKATQRDTGLVQVAQSSEPTAATLHRLRLVLALAIPVAVVLAAAGGYALTARAMAPIDAMTRTAMSIASGQRGLSTRLGLPDTDDELGRLGATFDAMLERIESSFERERRFAADASHELRTPLAGLQAILGTVALRPRTTSEYEVALQDIAVQTERLTALTGDLLALARGDGKHGQNSERVDLANLLRDVTETFLLPAQEKGIALVCDVPNAGVQIIADSDALVRLFVNLVDNAVKFTSAGRVRVTGEVQRGSVVEVAVADTGSGIAASDLPHVFERFYQVERASVTGTGLGLAIAQEIAVAHGTRIEVTSAPGEGSTFRVTFRLARQDGDRADGPHHAGGPPQS